MTQHQKGIGLYRYQTEIGFKKEGINMNWLRYFFGTPQRFLRSLIMIGVMICLVNPELFAQALNQAVTAILVALQPLLGPVLAVIIVFAGLRTILFGKGGKK